MSIRKLMEEVQATCLPRIEATLEEFLREQARQGVRQNAEMAAYHLSTGGKRLRALIPCWVFAAMGKDPLQAVPLGAAIEMIHNATLVHDDLQDGDTVRRGKPTVWKKYGEAQAVNCGDAMFYFGIELLLASGFDVRRTVNRTLRVIEGQAQEFLMKDEEYPSKERYLGMIRGKTAALIGLPVAAALEALGQPQDLIESAEAAASDCGVLFQVQDDLLDLYGDKKREQTATDVAEGKVSYLVAHVFETGSVADKHDLFTILRTPRAETTRAQIDQALGIFDRNGSKMDAIQLIRKVQNSIEAHPVLSRQVALRELLEELANLFLEPVRFLL